jgi:hypothetical protein
MLSARECSVHACGPALFCKLTAASNLVLAPLSFDMNPNGFRILIESNN